jgi:TPR repeat protein
MRLRDALLATTPGTHAPSAPIWYRRAAEQGLADAQFQLGLYYYPSGKVSSRDESQAEKWLRKAADQGHAKSQWSLVTLYQYGLGVAQSDAAAMSWYQKAASQGLAEAQYSIGEMYKRGDGVPQDLATAISRLRKAADQGYADAQYGVAIFCVPKDYVSAHMWLNLSAATGGERVAKLRETVEAQMTPSQIAEAQKLAREWKPKSAPR